MISEALRKVREEKQDEVKARQQARQAQQAKHAAAKHAPQASGKQPGAQIKAGQRSQGGERGSGLVGRKRAREQDAASNGSGGRRVPVQEEQAPQPKAEGSKTSRAAMESAVAVEKQQKILSAAVVPDRVRLELAARQMASAGAPAEAGSGKNAVAVGEAEASTLAKDKTSTKRKRLQLDDSSDDDEAQAPPGASKAAVVAQPETPEKSKQREKQTPVKVAKRAKSATPGKAARAQLEVTGLPSSAADDDADHEAEREQRKMREAAEKVSSAFPVEPSAGSAYMWLLSLVRPPSQCFMLEVLSSAEVPCKSACACRRSSR